MNRIKKFLLLAIVNLVIGLVAGFFVWAFWNDSIFEMFKIHINYWQSVFLVSMVNVLLHTEFINGKDIDDYQNDGENICL